MAGNLLGARSKFVYTADDNKTYSVITDDSLAVAGLGAAAAAPELFDPASPPANYAGRFPRGATPRKVYVEDAAGNRKALVAFSPTAANYATNIPKTVTIETVEFTSTGRVGERMTF